MNVDYLTTGAGDTADIILDGQGTFGVTINHSTANSTGAICEMVGSTPMHTGFITDTIGGFVLIIGRWDRGSRSGSFSRGHPYPFRFLPGAPEV